MLQKPILFNKKTKSKISINITERRTSAVFHQDNFLIIWRGNNKPTQYPRGISGQRRKLCLLKKMSRKSLPSLFDVLHCCSLWAFFFIGIINGLH